MSSKVSIDAPLPPKRQFVRYTTPSMSIHLNMEGRPVRFRPWPLRGLIRAPHELCRHLLLPMRCQHERRRMGDTRHKARSRASSTLKQRERDISWHGGRPEQRCVRHCSGVSNGGVSIGPNADMSSTPAPEYPRDPGGVITAEMGRRTRQPGHQLPTALSITPANQRYSQGRRAVTNRPRPLMYHQQGRGHPLPRRLAHRAPTPVSTYRRERDVRVRCAVPCRTVTSS